jgi:hypothetical protein
MFPVMEFAAQRLKISSGVTSDFSYLDSDAQMLLLMVKVEILP